MKAFWEQFARIALAGALQGASVVTQSGGTLANTGIGAGMGALAGILQFLSQHPAAQSPAVPVVTVTTTPPPPVTATPGTKA